MKIVDAGMAKVSRLYHYQRYVPKRDDPKRNDPKRLEQIVAGQVIYLSNPNDFNDPWDCRPYFNDDMTDHNVRDRLIQYYYRAARKQTPHVPEEEHRRRADWFRSNVAVLRQSIEQMSTAMAGIISQRYRLYCLTTNPADTLMWSHYSDNHRGICLEFATDNHLFSSALQVQYCETYPVLDFADDE